MSEIPTVEYDECLNNLGWEMTNWLQDCGTPVSGRAFNGMKPKLKEIIEKWLAAHPLSIPTQEAE
jgi:hypothetical protein